MKKQIAAILCISGLILGGCGNATLAEQGMSMEQTESAQAESTNICAYEAENLATAKIRANRVKSGRYDRGRSSAIYFIGGWR